VESAVFKEVFNTAGEIWFVFVELEYGRVFLYDFERDGHGVESGMEGEILGN
jgi:hypothetical protein